MDIQEILARMAILDKEMPKISRIKSQLIAMQNEKLALIIESLVTSSHQRYPHCQYLPPELEGRFKTFGYYGKKEPLARAIYYYVHSMGDTMEFTMPAGNIFRSCSNRDCLNPAHLVTAWEAKQAIERGKTRELEAGTIPAIIRRQTEAIDALMPLPPAGLSEEEIEEELKRQEEEIFTQAAQQKQD